MTAHIGRQFVAPEGLHTLEKGKVYHLLYSDSNRRRVLLVNFFSEQRLHKKKGRKTHTKEDHHCARLLVLPRSIFETALISGTIQSAVSEQMFPPWLKQLEGKSVSALEEGRHRRADKPKASNVERARQLADVIRGLLRDRRSDILCSDNPLSELRAHAATIGLNPTRFSVQSLTFMCFGEREESLYPAYQNIGRWVRQNHVGARLGRRSKSKGRLCGFILDEADKSRCEEGYYAFRRLKRSLNDIYGRTLTKIFGCLTEKTGSHRDYFHPDGHPFPSYDQFRSIVHKRVGREAVQTSLYGAIRVRTKKKSSAGRFSEAVGNFMSRVESDAYYTEEIPAGAENPLCVANTICVTSGKKVAIGFAEGRENSKAYRMNYFCMAIGKQKFCSLFGLTIDPSEWFSIGLPSFSTTDRGPGAKKKIVGDEGKHLPGRELPPSHQGQSKATIESANPRGVIIEGAKTYFQSTLTTHEMAIREIMNLLRHNESSDATSRLTPEMLSEGCSGTPNGIARFLKDRGRDDSHPIPFDEAVRAFLTQVPLSLGADGLYLEGQRYDSDDLRETGLLDERSRGQKVAVRGYVMEISTRHIWADVKGRLIELAAQLPICDDEDQLYMSLSELKHMAQLRKQARRSMRMHKSATAAHYRARFEELTGKDPEAGLRKRGRPKAIGESSPPSPDAQDGDQPARSGTTHPESGVPR